MAGSGSLSEDGSVQRSDRDTLNIADSIDDEPFAVSVCVVREVRYYDGKLYLIGAWNTAARQPCHQSTDPRPVAEGAPIPPDVEKCKYPTPEYAIRIRAIPKPVLREWERVTIDHKSPLLPPVEDRAITCGAPVPKGALSAGEPSS